MTHRQTTPRFAVAQLPNGLWSVHYKGVQIRSYDKQAWALRTADNLNSKENVVMSVMIWVRLQSSDCGEGAALSVIMVGILIVLAVFLRGFVLRRVRGF